MCLSRRQLFLIHFSVFGGLPKTVFILLFFIMFRLRFGQILWGTLFSAAWREFPALKTGPASIFQVAGLANPKNTAGTAFGDDGGDDSGR